ncbi:MAG: type II secretion system F family protein [Acidobacteria bacterium]|nr:type II secretion system F family protein [Acidobacteriota bacterium]
MAHFSYKAVSPEGRLTHGSVDASDTRAVTQRIQDMGLIPISIGETIIKSERGRIYFQRITRKDVLFFTEELATLVKASLPLDRSLSIAAELASKPALRTVIQDVLKQIKGGKSLAEALSAHPKQFSRLYVNMIRAGEAGGVLDTILARLAEFQRDADDLRGHLASALIYPALLTIVGLGSIAILMFFVIPRFAAIFEDLGAPIPFSTEILLTVSDWTLRYWPIGAPAIAIVVFLVRYWLQAPGGRRQYDAWRLRTPLLGATLLKIEVGRFARTFGTLLASAVPLIGAVRIVQEITTNQIVSEAISKIADGAKRGLGVARPMRDAGVFPPLAIYLVEVGEETGRLDIMLLQLADIYDKDVRTAVKSLTSVFEPAIILVMGVIVGTVVLSMLMAIFSINEIGF